MREEELIVLNVVKLNNFKQKLRDGFGKIMEVIGDFDNICFGE